MKNIANALTAILIAAALTACAASQSKAPSIDTSGLSLVRENHAVVSRDGANYILDSFIIPFQQPYYVLVRRSDAAVISLEAAEGIAREYIQPRGCTEPIKRRPDLDRSNSNMSAWIIGIEC